MKREYGVFNSQGVCCFAFTSKNRKSAIAKMNRIGYMISNGFSLQEG